VKLYLGGLFFKEAPKDGRYPWVFSTFDLDRHEERIDPKGWRLENYLKNPVVLWAHDSRIPAIGNAEGVAVTGGVLGGTVCFNEQSIDPFGWGIGQRVRTGVIRAGSVGFMVEKVEVTDSGDKSRLVIRQQELLEFSICNVPANPFALGSRGITHTEDISTPKKQEVRWFDLVAPSVY
jgi:HK97 family phage prohead protease